MLPQSPGVYQFVNRSGTIIYVGKAKSLRKRGFILFRAEQGAQPQRFACW